MFDLVVSGSCGAGFHDALRERAVPWQVTFDLSRMRFCEPFGLVAIAALAEAAIREGEWVVVRRPRDQNVANYLSRVRLGAVLAALGAEHDLPPVTEWDVGDALLELTPFDGARGAGVLAMHVHDAVEPINPEAAHALHEAIAEAGQNVDHHSGVRRGFVAAQRTYNRTNLHFAVGDSGAGMLASLREYGATSDSDAIHRALQAGVSGTGDPARGNGLPDMTEHLAMLNGRVEVMSGAAVVTARGNHRGTRQRDRSFPGTVLQGSVVVPVTMHR